MRMPRRWFLGGIFALLMVSLLASGCAPTSFLVTPVPAKRDLVEKVVQRESVWATQKVALIDVDGMLQNTRPRSMLGQTDDNPVSVFADKLKQAADDKNVAAVVLRINSPGGTVTASDIMYREVIRFRERTGKPVIAAMMDVAASGGYYIACAADRVYAHPTSVTGSIGVVMLLPDVSGTMSRIGMQVNVIKSGKMKDAGSMFREMSEQDRAVFQGMIDTLYGRFLEVVTEARRDVEPERIRALADGRVYLGGEAREHGLVDEIGDLRAAIVAAKDHAGLSEEAIKVVQYSRPYAHRPNIYARGDVPPAQVNLINVDLPEWLTGPAPQFLYVWAPGW